VPAEPNILTGEEDDEDVTMDDNEEGSPVTIPSFHSRKHVFQIANNPSLEGLVKFARFERGLQIGAILCQSGAWNEDGMSGRTAG
jgi:hypothetical protein